LSALLKNTTRSLLSKKPFGLLELGMKFATVAEKRKGENDILAREKATAAGDAFFAFDFGGERFSLPCFSPRRARPEEFWYSVIYQIVLALFSWYAFSSKVRWFLMAHVSKYTVANMQGLSIHLDRKTENHSNKNIDVDRSYLNYDLCQKDGDTLSRLQNRLKEVYCMKRKDVKACCEWVVTLPENLKGAPENDQREFFEKTYEFLANRYGGEKNVVSANVHVDETTPHMHFDFVPVVWDEKKQYEKVSAKEVLTRKELQSFHQELDVFLQAELPGIYREGVLNDKTIGIEDVKELKKYSDQIAEEKEKMSKGIELLEKKLEDKKKEFLEISQKLPEGKVEITVKGKEVKTTVTPKMFGKPEIVEKETKNFVISPEELKRLHATVAAAQKVKSEYERLQKTDLVQENQELRVEHADLGNAFDSLYTDWEEISVENRKLKEENKDLKAHISDLKLEIKLVYQSVKQFVKERTQGSVAFKETFKELIDKVREKTPEGDFEKTHRKELNKEKSRGMER